MKILITGASGFIGGAIVKRLQINSTVELICTTRHKSEASEKNIFFDLFSTNFEDNLLLKFGSPDLVLHCAWGNVKKINSLKHLDTELSYHMRFIENLARNGAKKIVVLGSCFEYGKQNGEVNENQIPNPNTTYAVAKDTLRRYIEFLNIKYEFDFQWLRIFYVYDEMGLEGSNIISLLKKAVDRGDKVFDMSLGEQCLDYTELKELSQMIEKIILQNKFNGIINCCSGKPIMVNELIQKSLKKWDRKINFNRGKYPYREFESLLIWGNRNLYKKIQ